jgi:uncharacterized protein YkwD
MVADVRSRVVPVGAGVVGLALLAWGLLLSSQTPAAALTNCTVPDMTLDAQETQFVTLLNQYRAQNGLQQLTVSTNLVRTATWMVNDMAANNIFSHTDSLGRAPAVRAVDCGYPIGAGENIAGGSGWDTAQEAMDAWKGSPGHNNNMLNNAWMQVGIARTYSASATYGWYWATTFGSTDDGTSGGGAPAPTNTPTSTPTATRTNTPAGSNGTPTAAPTATPTSPPPTPTQASGGGAPPAPTATTATAATRPPAPTPTAGSSGGGSPAGGGSGGATTTPTAAATRTATPSGSIAKDAVPLKPGANLVTWPGNDASPADALGGSAGNIAAVYAFDPTTRTWRRYAPGAPAYVNNLVAMKKGEAYWIIAKSQANLLIER